MARKNEKIDDLLRKVTEDPTFEVVIRQSKSTQESSGTQKDYRAKEEELRRRQEELDKREAELNRRESSYRSDSYDRPSRDDDSATYHN